MNDLRYAFRQLLKNPGFTAVAIDWQGDAARWSPRGATENSPGRQPWDRSSPTLQAPKGRKRWRSGCAGFSFAPRGLVHADAAPRLTPWAILFRLSEAALRGMLPNFRTALRLHALRTFELCHSFDICHLSFVILYPAHSLSPIAYRLYE
jgi:hypothetical protein